jgi:hypothetical protein
LRLPPLRIENHLRELSERIWSAKKEFQDGVLGLEDYLRLRCGLETEYRKEAEVLLRRTVLRRG